jgi:hypothetical protein
VRPRRVVIGFTMPWALAGADGALRRLTAELALALAGPAVGADDAHALGAAWLSGDPAASAAEI